MGFHSGTTLGAGQAIREGERLAGEAPEQSAGLAFEGDGLAVAVYECPVLEIVHGGPLSWLLW